jgi:flavin reductase (DIM6/NTAB) family NADH-FMN oxidoreductase RutF
MSSNPGISVDATTLRRTVGQFVTGVTIIAAEADGSVHAMTANSFTSLSLDPPLVLFCAGKDSKVGQLMHVGVRFSVNLLREEQRDLSTYFAGAWKAASPPAFSFVEWGSGSGLPTRRLAGSAAAIACTAHAVHEGGDHWIVVGHVVAVDRPEDTGAPLVFHAGRYVRLEPARLEPARLEPARLEP